MAFPMLVQFSSHNKQFSETLSSYNMVVSCGVSERYRCMIEGLIQHLSEKDCMHTHACKFTGCGMVDGWNVMNGWVL